MAICCDQYLVLINLWLPLMRQSSHSQPVVTDSPTSLLVGRPAFSETAGSHITDYPEKWPHSAFRFEHLPMIPGWSATFPYRIVEWWPVTLHQSRRQQYPNRARGGPIPHPPPLVSDGALMPSSCTAHRRARGWQVSDNTRLARPSTQVPRYPPRTPATG